MRKEGIVGGFFLLTAIVLLLRFSPGDLSLFFIGVMSALVIAGYMIGFIRIMNLSRGFLNARAKIDRARTVQTDSPWLVILEEEKLFLNDSLDQEFDSYRRNVRKQLGKKNAVIAPIEELIDEDFIALHTWNSLIVQVPGTLTGLGILGTFLGLVIGMDGMGFSSVSSAMGSITVMLSGIRMAFYTSIGGVILSILFNLIYHTIWEMMLQERGLFFRDFHQYIIPKTEEQIRQNEGIYQIEMLEQLNQISVQLTQITGFRKDRENEETNETKKL